MAIASLIIFLNTTLNFLKEEANREDSNIYLYNLLVLASFWAFLVCGGFVISTLLPIINIIQIFDANPD